MHTTRVDSVVVSHRHGDTSNTFAMFFPKLNFASILQFLPPFPNFVRVFLRACVFLRATSPRVLSTLAAWRYHPRFMLTMLRPRKSRFWNAVSSRLRPKRQRSPTPPDVYQHMPDSDRDSINSLDELMRNHRDGFYKYSQQPRVGELDAKSETGSLILRPSASLEDDLRDQHVVSFLPGRFSWECFPEVVSPQC